MHVKISLVLHVRVCNDRGLIPVFFQDLKTIENFKHVGDSDDPLNERCFQIVTADSFTNTQFYNFMAFSKKDCKVNSCYFVVIFLSPLMMI